MLIPPAEQYEVDKKAAYVTYDDEQYVYQEAKDGLRVTSYQVRYLNGQEQERKFLDTDTFKAKPRIVYIGAKPRPMEG